MTAVQKKVGSPWLDVEGRPGYVLPRRFVLRLQQTIGNQAVVRMLAPPTASIALVSAASAARTPEPVARATGMRGLWRRLWRRKTQNEDLRDG